MSDILQFQRETGQKFCGIFKMGNILELDALKIIVAS